MEYKYNIIGDVYYWMISGKKDIEVRILKEKSKTIKIGDYIIFNNQDSIGKYVKVKVVNKTIVANIEELIEKFDVERIMPGHTKKELVELMKKIYGDELTKKEIVAFEFEYLPCENDLELIDTITCEEFLEVIETVGFKTYSNKQVEKALKNTMYMVKAKVDGKLAGIGRVIGDYSIVCCLSDICVKPEFQGKGIGLKIVKYLKDKIEENVKDGEKIQIELTPTAGKEEFYKKAGFKYKPDVITGMYLWIEK